MGQLDKTFNEESYETRELAWELQQPHPDHGRVRLFLEQDANLRDALRLANIEERDLLKKPALRTLHLERHLHG
ncbi:MAG: hypothetical protein ACK4PK_11835 [Alphaproteobacteria bacterium]|jgi:hypothetical protein